jgi:hypothetical protein
MVVLGLWTAMVAKAPVDSGPASPQFLSVNFGSLFAFIFFVFWGVALRGNPAAHKRIMILSTVAILDPGYGRLTGWLWPEPHSMLTWYFFNFLGGRVGSHGDGCLGRMARPSDEAICRRRNRPRHPPVFTGLPLPLGSVEGIQQGADRNLGHVHPISKTVLQWGGCRRCAHPVPTATPSKQLVMRNGRRNFASSC